MTVVREWFDAHVAAAPTVLVDRAGEFLARATGGTAAERCAMAGSVALLAAEEHGAGREAALDLLAADALITLALLDVAERAPATLGEEAARLRRLAAAAG